MTVDVEAKERAVVALMHALRERRGKRSKATR
jgi:hypothetical protein